MTTRTLRRTAAVSRSTSEVQNLRTAGNTDRVAANISQRFGWIEAGVYYADAYSTGIVGAVAAAVAAGGARVQLSPDTDYDFNAVASAISITAPIEIIGGGPTTRIVGDGAETHDLFDVRSKFTLRDLTIVDHGGRVIDMTSAGAIIDGLHLAAVTFDTCGSQLSGEDAIIHDGGNNYGIKRSTIHHCVFDSCHGGIRLRSAAINKIFIHHNIFDDLTASAISIGDNGGVTAHADILVHDNIIDGVVQAAASGTEAHGIIVLARHARIHDNIVRDVRNGGGGNDEPIYTKCAYGSVHDNFIYVTGTAPSTTNGIITVKGDERGASDPTDVLGYGVNVHGNTIFCDVASNTLVGIGVFREDTHISNNTIEGVAIAVQLTSDDAIERVTVHQNRMLNLLQGGVNIQDSGGNITVTDNIIDGVDGTGLAAAFGILLANDSATATAENYIISGNLIKDVANATANYGIREASTQSVTNLQICDNIIDNATNPIRHNGSAAPADLTISGNRFTNIAGTDVRYYIRGFAGATGFVRIFDNGDFSPRNADVVTFTDADTTPSVSVSINGRFVTANTGATSITTFDGGADSQEITVYLGDANTTFVNGGTLKNKSGGNDNPASGAIKRYRAVNVSGTVVWYEI